MYLLSSFLLVTFSFGTERKLLIEKIQS